MIRRLGAVISTAGLAAALLVIGCGPSREIYRPGELDAAAWVPEPVLFVTASGLLLAAYFGSAWIW